MSVNVNVTTRVFVNGKLVSKTKSSKEVNKWSDGHVKNAEVEEKKTND